MFRIETKLSITLAALQYAKTPERRPVASLRRKRPGRWLNADVGHLERRNSRRRHRPFAPRRLFKVSRRYIPIFARHPETLTERRRCSSGQKPKYPHS